MTKYPCSKEAAKQQAALDALKAEMLLSMADMIQANNCQLAATASQVTDVEEEGTDENSCCGTCQECAV
jgi:hypothetical protein